MSTRCSNVGAMLHVNMLSFNVGPMLKLNSDMQVADSTSSLIKGKRGRERCQHIVSMLVQYSRTPLIRPPSESHWCGRIRGMVAREGLVYEQKALSVTRNVVVWEG